MELLQIIIFTLKLFAGASVTLVCVSYVVFKIKDRKRPKPYMQSYKANTSAQSLSIENNREELKNRFKVLNNKTLVPVEIRRTSSSRPAAEFQGGFNEPITAGEVNIYNYYSRSNVEPMQIIYLELIFFYFPPSFWKLRFSAIFFTSYGAGPPPKYLWNQSKCAS